MKIILQITFIILIINSNKAISDIQKELNLYNLLLKASQQNGSFMTVGSASNCDFSSISQALSSGSNNGIEEIRISNNQIYNENLLITNNNNDLRSNIILRGGFANCTQATNNNQTSLKTAINGSQIDTVIKIFDIVSINIILENLKLFGGSTNQGGGGLSLDNTSENIQVLLDNMELSNNRSIGITGGGGIMCSDPFSRITIVNSKINNNSVNSGMPDKGPGGGISILNGCEVTIYSPAEINGNTSAADGGGIYVANGSALNLLGQETCFNNNCLGSNQFPIEIIGNSAGFPNLINDGGGIYIRGFNGLSQSTIFSYGINISGNSARNGAGLFSKDNVSIVIQKNNKNCWSNTKCNYFSGNKTTTQQSTNTAGGAIYNLNSSITVRHAVFEDNRADVASAIYTTGPQGFIEVLSSLFNHNGNNGTGGWNDLYVMRAYNNSFMQVSASTIVDNQATAAVFGIDTSSIMLTSSIIDDAGSGNVVLLTNPISTDFKCLIAHETSTIIGNHIDQNNPSFVNPSIRDYHITLNSPAIDFCDTDLFVKDIDFENRGFDDPRISNNFSGSKFDIGMDEYIDEFSFLIFENSFE